MRLGPGWQFYQELRLRYLGPGPDWCQAHLSLLVHPDGLVDELLESGPQVVDHLVGLK